MELSLRVITDYNCLLELEDAWNLEVNRFGKNPFLLTSVLSEYMQFFEKEGWSPFVFSFWSNNRLVGIVPLKFRKRFFSYAIRNFFELQSDFFFDEEHHELCLNQLVCYLFNKLKFQSAEITLYAHSPDVILLEKICKKNGLFFWNAQHMSNALVFLEKDFDSFASSLKSEDRREFRKLKRKLDGLGDWRISCSKLDDDSFETICSIEKMSWKAEWRARKKIVAEDSYIRLFFKIFTKQKARIEPFMASEVWFLEVNGQAIAYQLNLFHGEKVFFIKTSYNKKFRKFSPGKFLINEVIGEMIKKGNVKVVDFITALPFVHSWRPFYQKRKKMYIERNPFVPLIIHFISQHPLMEKLVKFVLR